MIDSSFRIERNDVADGGQNQAHMVGDENNCSVLEQTTLKTFLIDELGSMGVNSGENVVKVDG